MKFRLRVTCQIFGVIAALCFTGQSVAAQIQPLQQSECEVAANAYAAKHPHDDFMTSRFFPFWGNPPPGPPLTYLDAESGISFHVDSDGRHVTAIDKAGNQLWKRNPFVEENMCPYRSSHPFISWIGPPGAGFGFRSLSPHTPTPDAEINPKIVTELNREIDRGRKDKRPRDHSRFLGLTFNSSQKGFLNIQNGDFYSMGQN